MKTKQQFRKGQIARAIGCKVLVTGPGDKSEGYPCFSGVVVHSWKTNEEEKPWPVGTYSKTWVTSAFKKDDVKIYLLSK